MSNAKTKAATTHLRKVISSALKGINFENNAVPPNISTAKCNSINPEGLLVWLNWVAVVSRLTPDFSD